MATKKVQKKKATKKVKDAKIISVEDNKASVYIEEKKSVETMITQAIKSNAPVESLEKFMDMRRELKAEYAKEQFDIAMSNFQSECPEIKKTKSVPTKSGQIAYSYAPIESIVRQVKDVLTKNGLSYTIKTEVNGKVKSICIIKHVAGHSEKSEMEVPLGAKTGVMSDSQVVAAAATFSKRYAFMNALGIMTGDEDNEEQLSDSEVSPDEKNKALDQLSQCMSINTLKTTWNGFSKEIKADKDVIIRANEIKSFIEEQKNENS